MTFEEIPYYGWGMFGKEGTLLSDYPIATKHKPNKNSLIEGTKKELEDKAKKEKVNKEKGSIKLWFGKYSDKTLKQVEKENKGYLTWMYDTFDFNGVKMLRVKNELEEILKLPPTNKLPF